MKDGFPDGLDQTALWNALLAAMAEGFALGGRGRAVLRVAEPARPAERGAIFAVAGDAGRVFVQAVDLPVAGLTGGALDAAGLARLPVALADAVLELALDEVIAATGLRLHVQSVMPATPADMAGEEWLRAEVDAGWGAPAVFLVAAERRVFLRLARGLMPMAGRAVLPQAVAAGIPLACSLRRAGPDLPLARLRRLARGDILLARGGMQFCAPHARFAVQGEGETLTIGEVAMNDDLPVAGMAEPAAEMPVMGDIGEVPVRISFVLAERVMTLAEVQGLTQGALLPMRADGAQSVRILANGRAMGEGHVVQIDGQPAVRIASLYGQG